MSLSILMYCVILFLLMAANFSLVQWNSQGFKNHGPEFLWQMNQNNNLPSVICLQETFYSCEEDIIDIENYNISDFSSRGTKRGGTAIYCRSDIKYTKVNFTSKFEISAVNIIHDKKKLLIFMIQITMQFEKITMI